MTHAPIDVVSGPATAVEPPLGYAFRTDRGGRYFYDANTNRLLRLSETQFRAIAEMIKGGASALGAEEAEALGALRRQGLLLGPGVRATQVAKHRGCLEAKIRTCLSQLILEVTERCNLRCVYCVFGAGYRGQREHGTRDMTREDMRRALDYFYAHNEKAPSTSVGFYGGEPLLAWDLIREALKILPSYPRGSATHVHLTTNGTLLTNDKFRDLADHDVALLVSLDGPREIHDRCRRTAGATGTYSRVTENLRALRRFSKTYYETNVSFSCVRTPGVTAQRLVDYFSSNPLTRGRHVQISGLSPGCPDLARRLAEAPPTGSEDSGRSDDEMLGEYLVDVLRDRMAGPRRRVLHDLFGRRYISFHRRPVFPGPATDAGLNGMCTPGWRKLFIAVNGEFHTCERVRRDWPIGHVATGIDLDRVFGYLGRHAEFHRSRCERCWAVRLCGGCQSSIGGSDGVDSQRADEFCESERRELAELILLYTRVLERRSRAFDFIEEISIS